MYQSVLPVHHVKQVVLELDLLALPHPLEDSRLQPLLRNKNKRKGIKSAYHVHLHSRNTSVKV